MIVFETTYKFLATNEMFCFRTARHRTVLHKFGGVSYISEVCLIFRRCVLYFGGVSYISEVWLIFVKPDCSYIPFSSENEILRGFCICLFLGGLV